MSVKNGTKLVGRLLIGLVLVVGVTGFVAAADALPAEQLSGLAGEAPAETKILQTYDMSWWSVDGGGGSSSGGDFALIGSIGQPDAGSAGGCGTALAGGVWSGPEDCETPLFCDGFESGDTGAWSSVTP